MSSPPKVTDTVKNSLANSQIQNGSHKAKSQKVSALGPSHPELLDVQFLRLVVVAVRCLNASGYGILSSANTSMLYKLVTNGDSQDESDQAEEGSGEKNPEKKNTPSPTQQKPTQASGSQQSSSHHAAQQVLTNIQILGSLVDFFVSPLVGRLLDQKGRRFAITAAMVAAGGAKVFLGSVAAMKPKKELQNQKQKRLSNGGEERGTNENGNGDRTDAYANESDPRDYPPKAEDKPGARLARPSLPRQTMSFSSAQTVSERRRKGRGSNDNVVGASASSSNSGSSSTLAVPNNHTQKLQSNSSSSSNFASPDKHRARFEDPVLFEPSEASYAEDEAVRDLKRCLAKLEREKPAFSEESGKKLLSGIKTEGKVPGDGKPTKLKRTQSLPLLVESRLGLKKTDDEDPFTKDIFKKDIAKPGGFRRFHLLNKVRSKEAAKTESEFKEGGHKANGNGITSSDGSSSSENASSSSSAGKGGRKGVQSDVERGRDASGNEQRTSFSADESVRNKSSPPKKSTKHKPPQPPYHRYPIYTVPLQISAISTNPLHLSDVVRSFSRSSLARQGASPAGSAVSNYSMGNEEQDVGVDSINGISIKLYGKILAFLGLQKVERERKTILADATDVANSGSGTTSYSPIFSRLPFDNPLDSPAAQKILHSKNFRIFAYYVYRIVSVTLAGPAVFRAIGAILGDVFGRGTQRFTEEYAMTMRYALLCGVLGTWWGTKLGNPLVNKKDGDGKADKTPAEDRPEENFYWAGMMQLAGAALSMGMLPETLGFAEKIQAVSGGDKDGSQSGDAKGVSTGVSPKKVGGSSAAPSAAKAAAAVTTVAASTAAAAARTASSTSMSSFSSLSDTSLLAVGATNRHFNIVHFVRLVKQKLLRLFARLCDASPSLAILLGSRSSTRLKYLFLLKALRSLPTYVWSIEGVYRRQEFAKEERRRARLRERLKGKLENSKEDSAPTPFLWAGDDDSKLFLAQLITGVASTYVQSRMLATLPLERVVLIHEFVGIVRYLIDAFPAEITVFSGDSVKKSKSLLAEFVEYLRMKLRETVSMLKDSDSFGQYLKSGAGGSASWLDACERRIDQALWKVQRALGGIPRITISGDAAAPAVLGADVNAIADPLQDPEDSNADADHCSQATGKVGYVLLSSCLGVSQFGAEAVERLIQWEAAKVNLGQGELGAVSDAVLTLVPSIIMPWIFGNMFKKFLADGLEEGGEAEKEGHVEEELEGEKEKESLKLEPEELEKTKPKSGAGLADAEANGSEAALGGTGEADRGEAFSQNQCSQNSDPDYDRPLLDPNLFLNAFWRLLRWQKGVAEKLYQMRYNPYWVGIAMHLFNFRVLVPWVFLKLRES